MLLELMYSMTIGRRSVYIEKAGRDLTINFMIFLLTQGVPAHKDKQLKTNKRKRVIL